MAALMQLFNFLLCLQIVYSNLKENELQTAYVTYSYTSKTFSVVDYEVKEWVAKAEFQNSVNKTCWAFLDVTTSSSYNSSSQAYAAGLVEGYITRDLIAMSWQNTVAGYCTSPYSDYCTRLQTFLQTNYKWVMEQIKQNPDSPYWHNVEMFYAQLMGLEDGYLGTGPGKVHYDLDVFGMYMLQIGGDLEDLESALHKPQQSRVLGSGSCSALIKLLPDFSDLYVAQDTWSGFNSMLRILKRYNFSYTMTDSTSGKKNFTTFNYDFTIYFKK
ncbi:hypothetical protein SNE40_002555 [Patella caerulea]|uniref:Phospholipase B-like n=1 Tax=Patella caerulea TaxID=87958 RepID=A0AAN8QEC8_PATCE